MSEDVFPSGGLIPGEDDLPVSPHQILALPVFCEAKTKLRRCQEALVLRIFKKAANSCAGRGRPA